MYLISGVMVQGWCHRYGYDIQLLYGCYMRHGPRLTGVNYPTGHKWPSTMAQTCTAVILVVETNHSNQCTQTVVWWSKDDDIYMYMLCLCYTKVIWDMDYVFQGWITPQIKAWSPTIPRTCSDATIVLGPKSLNHGPISVVVVQGRWYMYVHAISLFYECYMRYGLCLTGMNHLTDHIMTSNYTPNMLSCYPGFWEKQIDHAQNVPCQRGSGPRKMTHVWI